MENVITLRQFVGQVAGSTSPESVVRYPMDEILCNGKRIGFVNHTDGATIRFVRVLSEPTRRDIRDQVAKLRASLGGPTVAEATAQPPNPDHMAAYLRRLAEANGEAEGGDSDDE